MRITKPLLLLCSSIFFLVSCLSDPETHQLALVTGNSLLFADQTEDSVKFYTFDSWQTTPQSDWISIAGDSRGDIKYDYSKRYLCRVDVSLKPNTTGCTRQGRVLIESYEYSSYAFFTQLGMLDVRHPDYTVKEYFDISTLLPETVEHVLIDSTGSGVDSICFRVYKDWTLTFEDSAKPDWIDWGTNTSEIIDEKKIGGRPGRNRVNLTLEPNTTENERETTLLLTSGEVVNPITVRQLPVKKTE